MDRLVEIIVRVLVVSILVFWPWVVLFTILHLTRAGKGNDPTPPRMG